MAVYRIGDILRMKREALGITREKLCELSNDICSVQTLYRIECGKVKVKQELYRQLMKCMGELTERNYASIVVSENQYLNLKSEIHAHIFYGEYQQAEEKLLQLEQEMNPRYIRNKQYLMEKRATLAYRQNKMTSEEYKDILFDALRCTIPHFDQIDIAHWPLNNEEFTILLYAVNTFYIMKQRDTALDLLLKLKENTERRYMEEDYYIVWHTNIVSNLSLIMINEKEYETAEKYIIQGIYECKKQRISGGVGTLLSSKVINMIRCQEEKDDLEKKGREVSQQLLVQAYYLCLAQNEISELKKIKKICERYYPGEVKFLL